LPLTGPALGSVAWLAIVNSIAAFAFFFWLLRNRGGGAATSYLPPVFEAEFFAAQLHGDRLFFGDDVFADPDGAYRDRLGGHALFLRAGHHEWVDVLGWVHRRGWGRGGDSGGGFGPAGGRSLGEVAAPPWCTRPPHSSTARLGELGVGLLPVTGVTTV